jgi:uncharacterized membrane protein
MLSCLSVISLILATNILFQISHINNHSLFTNALESKNISNHYNFQKITELNSNQTVLAHNMEVKIYTDFQFKIVSEYVISNNGTEPLDFFALDIYKNISSVYVSDPLGSLSFNWKIIQSFENQINISFRYPLLPENLYIFSIEYQLLETVYNVEEPVEYYGFDYQVNHSLDSRDFNLNIILPFGSSLLSNDVGPLPVSPNPTKIFDENGLINIEWEEGSITSDDIDSYSVRFQIHNELFTNQNNIKPYLIVIIALGSFILGGLVVFSFYYFGNILKQRQQVLASLMSKSERRIITEINKEGGVSTQNRICDRTGYSKSKVSQILSRLEKKKVLTRERWGRTNKVSISNPAFQDRFFDTNNSNEQTNETET